MAAAGLLLAPDNYRICFGSDRRTDGQREKEGRIEECHAGLEATSGQTESPQMKLSPGH